MAHISLCQLRIFLLESIDKSGPHIGEYCRKTLPVVITCKLKSQFPSQRLGIRVIVACPHFVEVFQQRIDCSLFLCTLKMFNSKTPLCNLEIIQQLFIFFRRFSKLLKACPSNLPLMCYELFDF